MRHTYIICYDICDDKRLRKVYELMRGYGDHLQYSVFQCELSEKEVIELKGRLTDKIKHDEDQVLFIPLGPPAGRYVKGIFALGLPYFREDRSCFVF